MAKKQRERNDAGMSLQFFIQAAPISMLLIDQLGMIRYLNSASIELLGYVAEELIGQPVELLMPWEDRKRHVLHRQQYTLAMKPRAMGSGFEIYALSKSGKKIPIEVMLSPILINQETFILCSIIDVTEKRKAQNVLRDSNESLEKRVIERTEELNIEREKLHQSQKLFTENKQLYELILDAVTDGWWDWNLETDDEYLSPKFKALFGYSEQELSNHADSWKKIIYSDDLNKVLLSYNDHIHEDKPFAPIVRYHCKNGGTKWVLCRGQAIQDNDGKFRRMIGTHTDITVLKDTEQKLQENLIELDLIYRGTKIVSEMGDFVDSLRGLVDLICRIINWPIGHVYFPRSETELSLDSDIWTFNSLDLEKINSLIRLMNQVEFQESFPFIKEILLDGKIKWVEDLQIKDNEFGLLHELKSALGFPIFVNQKVIAICVFFSEERMPENKKLIRAFQMLGIQIGRILERKKVEIQLEELAHFDLVTRLPNRAYFYEMLGRSIQRSKKTNKEFGVLYLDLDNFKKINDSLGHAVGDKLLRHVAKKIQEVTSVQDFVARLGGDEFVILIEENTDSSKHAMRIAKEVIGMFKDPFYIDQHELNTSVSVGIAIFPNCGSDVNSLMKNADMAMYSAKESGKNTYHFFSEELNNDYKRKITIESYLRHAIEKNEFSLVYQPQFSLKNGKIYGFEVLLRWETAGLGSVSPSEFIPVAEDMGLIGEIGNWVLEHACQEFSLWEKNNANMLEERFVLSINLSVLQLTYNEISLKLTELINQLNFSLDRLLLEVTETAIMQNLADSISTLKLLNSIGVKVSIDDFGTGYSSLNYLKQLPFNALKIDQSFVRDIATDINDAAIVKAIIQLGVALDLEIVAEGIENEEQLMFLKNAGCHYGQGFYLSRPLPLKDMLSFMERVKNKE